MNFSTNATLKTIRATITARFFADDAAAAWETAKQYGNRNHKSTWFKLADAMEAADHVAPAAHKPAAAPVAVAPKPFAPAVDEVPEFAFIGESDTDFQARNEAWVSEIESAPVAGPAAAPAHQAAAAPADLTRAILFALVVLFVGAELTRAAAATIAAVVAWGVRVSRANLAAWKLARVAGKTGHSERPAAWQKAIWAMS